MAKDSNLVLLFSILVGGGGAAAQVPQWVQASGTYNAAVSGAESTFDHLHDRTVGFGGQIGYLPVAYTSLFDGDAWSSPAVASAPPGRVSHVMGFDAGRGEVVAYGGAILGPTYFTDTWVWNGANWAQRFPAHVPTSSSGLMAYDEARGVLVLLAGGVLWDWDGVDWHQTVAVPTASPAAMVYDGRRSRLVVFGAGTLHEYDGQQWSQPTPAGVAPVLSYPRAAYDRERGCSVLVGYDGTPSLATFEYDGASWTQGPSLPAWVPLSTLVYDRLRGRIVMHCGRDGNGTNPNWSGTTWFYHVPGLAVAQPYGIACGSPALRVHEDAAARPLLGTTFGFDIVNVPTGVAFVCFGWSRRSVLGLTLPMPMAQWGLPGCWLLQSDDAIALPSQAVAANTTRFAMAIPASPTFAGLQFHLQPWAPAPGANAAGAVIGDALGVTIGAH